MGVVGTGYWAEVVHARGAAAHPGVELVGIWGRDRAKADALAEQHQMSDLVRRVRDARGWRRPVWAVRLPGRAAAGMAKGGLLPGPGARTGRQTFAEWLALTEADRARPRSD
jgi:hypothetical protein